MYPAVIATEMGLRFCDRRACQRIISKPQPARLSNVVFVSEFGRAYVTCGDKVFKRKVCAEGTHAFGPFIKPSAPRLCKPATGYFINSIWRARFIERASNR